MDVWIRQYRDLYQKYFIRIASRNILNAQMYLVIFCVMFQIIFQNRCVIFTGAPSSPGCADVPKSAPICVTTHLRCRDYQ